MLADIEKIRQLAAVMAEVGLTEIEVEGEGGRIRLSKQAALTSVATWPPTELESTPLPKPSTASGTSSPYGDCRTIESPLVGTFYRAATPDGEALVALGDRVAIGTPVCILEAMKVMNEILSDVEGTVVEIPVQNAEPVEFGQVLFYIRPA
ncbi:MAG: acetyl-CoA carboxylase biotin carboxyl carrier protein [Puniceicoccales bacterium]|jgi:acetyl-CoA carboxylase biotin carboxyl carrier protein|nr:acetyl-CoA carboxylase biotin carboxyl carrier protein [Puniceicoccales bacterium]